MERIEISCFCVRINLVAGLIRSDRYKNLTSFLFILNNYTSEISTLLGD